MILQFRGQDQAAASGLPVMVLDQPDWYRALTPDASPKAWRQVRFEVGAEHVSGWAVSLLARAQATIEATPDSVALARLDALNANPAQPQSFQVGAHSIFWRGTGLRVQAPWLALGFGDWAIRPDLQWLRLSELRLADIQGQLNYAAASYDFDLTGYRANPQITAPFVPPSGMSGQATSVSFALQGSLSPTWRLNLRMDDALSQVSWPDLATDASRWNSRVTTRAADGSLDYAAIVNGRVALLNTTTHLPVHGQAQLDWTPPRPGLGYFARLDRLLGLNQYWLGVQNQATSAWRWSLACEPSQAAFDVRVGWKGVSLGLQSDAKADQAQRRAVSVQWALGF